MSTKTMTKLIGKNGLTNSMSKLALAMVLMSGLGMSSSAVAGALGDLEVYTPPQNQDSPTLLFMLETSTFMNSYDTTKWLYGNEEKADASGQIKYNRYYTYNLGGPKYYSRITRLRDTLFYLMDATNPDGTPVIPADYKIGLGHYTGSGGKSGNFDGQRAQSLDPVGSVLVVPAWKLGDINSEHRQRIKRYVASLCNSSNNCTGEAPMAWAYAEAGAYMMGTKTSPIIPSQNAPATEVLTRRLRGRNPLGSLAKEWQVCPDGKQKAIAWVASSYRLDCADGDWVTVNKDNASQYGLEWNCGLLNCTSLTNRPHGIDGWHKSKWYFTIDGISNPNDGWSYFVDRASRPTNVPTMSLNITNNYYGSGIRNSSMYLRKGKTMGYEKPDLGQCSGAVTNDIDPVTGVKKQVGAQNGIIFFTAGFPRSGIATSSEHVMNMALTPEGTNSPSPVGGNVDCNSGLSNAYSGIGSNKNPINNNWHCMGGFAKRLNSENNPHGKAIKTGVFMFASGGEFLQQSGTKKGIPTYDCASTNSPLTIRNACKLATSDYGGGGYIQTSQPTSDDANKQLAQLLNNYKSSDDVELGSVPSSLPVFVKNPYYPNELQENVFLPLLRPDSTSNLALIQGNLRKYKTGTTGFVDQDNNSPFTTTFNQILSTTTRDFWSAKEQPYISRSKDGGSYEKLPGFSVTIDKRRRVYLENTNGSSMTKLQPKAANMALVNVSGISGTQDDLRRRLLNFMGYGISKFVSGSTDNTKPNTTDNDIEDTKGKAERVFGGVFHSTPEYIGYEASYSATGIATPTKGSIIVGSMNNALHILDATSGEEQLAFIPREVLSGENYKALTADGKMTNAPSFGVDAPWTVDTRYDYDLGNRKIKASNVNVYGGLRLGGKRYYALDITKLNDPKLRFSLHADLVQSGKKPFQRMGYTWAKPVIAKINWEGKPKRVMIVPAGYDKTYDLTDDKRVGLKSNETKGNAVYIVSAEGNDAGKALFVLGKNTSQGASSVSASNTNMKYSIVGRVKTLDRNVDGLIDHIYFADLGGQVFRADINNGIKNTNSVPSAIVKRVHRIANLKNAHGSDAPGPRFYETPVVTIHRKGSQRFAAVSVASGDRSSPAFKNSEAVTGFSGYTNRVYVVLDKDVTRGDLYTSNISLNTTDITLTGMTNAPSNENTKKMLLTNSERLDGWYQPLNQFGSTTDTKHLKAYGPLAALDNDLYVSVYNYYDDLNNSTLSCSSQIRGKSEAHQFCLPFGQCNTNVNRKRFAIGKGILPISFGAFGNKPTNRQLLTVEESSTSGGSGGGTPTQPQPKPTYETKPQRLIPLRWYQTKSLEPIAEVTGTE